MNLRQMIHSLHTTDLLVIAFGAFVAVLNVVFYRDIPHWWQIILINGCGTAAILLLAYARSATGWRILAYVHDWYAVPVVFFMFKELYFVIRPIHGYQDMDSLLIAADRWLFGVDPTVWLMQYAHPVVTEILQIAYTTFYFLFILVGYELYRRPLKGPFHYFMFSCVYGFFLSYLGYLLVPGVGPRFTLHDFSALDQDLPGVFLTPYLRWFVNAGESVPMNVPNAISHAAAQRDVFPSGHTMMTLVLMYFGVHYRLKARWFLVITGTLLIAATVYQRYHYVIDLIAGALFFVVCLLTAPRVFSFVRANVHTIDKPYPWKEIDTRTV
jgi:membrane-associated phospholipid phosphatase